MTRENLLRFVVLTLMIGSVVFAIGLRCWIALSGLNSTPSAEAIAEAKTQRHADKEHAMAAMKEERAKQRADAKEKLEPKRRERQEAQHSVN